MTPNEIRRAGLQALTQSLGAVGMVRFLQQTEIGWGDYTKERSQWLGQKSLAEIRTEILRLKQDAANPLRKR
ncbi:MAG: hypothetical protein E6Q83_04525 [Thiothrix sp.]|nr:MAG: hypothetical protein E6Q83_04525 [Thiothrix sp.]